MKRKRVSVSGAQKEEERSISQAASTDGTSSAISKRRNPFLDSSVDRALDEAEINILPYVLKFMEHSKTTGRKATPSDVIETLNVLIAYVDEAAARIRTRSDGSDESPRASPLISPEDIVEMLLPWSTRELARAASNFPSDGDADMVAWKVMTKCLQFQFRKGDGSIDRSRTGNRSETFPQSILNKIVPLAADVAFSKSQSAASTACECYEILVDRLYRPTLNVACESILMSIEEKVRQSCTDSADRPVLLSVQQMGVVAATVRLLRHIQVLGVASPKKTFQVLADSKVFGTLSYLHFLGGEEKHVTAIQGDIKALIWEGLFSPSNHMDGFRSMNMTIPSFPDSGTVNLDREGDAEPETRKRHHCYQAYFLETIHGLISGKDGLQAHKFAVIQFVPSLLNGYVAQCTKWEHHLASVRKLKHRAKQNDAASSQFRFWANLAYHLLGQLIQDGPMTANETSLLTNALLESLKILLDHDTYLPSHDDKDGKKLSFLDSVTDRLCRIGVVRPEILRCIDVLTRLNHHTVHDRLPQILLLCAVPMASRTRSLDEGSDASDEADLLSTLIVTYSKLRQLDHLFGSILGATSLLSGSAQKISGAASQNDSYPPKEKNITSLRHLIHCPQVATALSLAVRQCPHGQIGGLFHALSSSIKDNLNLAEESDETKARFHRVVSSAVTSIFVVLLRNTRVDGHTASDVAQRCNEVVELAVRPTLRNTSSEIHVRRQILLLLGWIVELQTKCAFWLDEVPVADGDTDLWFSRQTGEILVTVLSKTALEEETWKATRDSQTSALAELQFLAFFRLQQLHSLIYEQERKARTSTHADSSGVTALVSEAARLVHFVITFSERGSSACKITSSFAERPGNWTMAARMAPYWVPYATPAHIEAFLAWVFQSIAFISLISDEHTVFQSDAEVAMSLLCDASFVEMPPIVDRLRRVGLACVSEKVGAALKSSGDHADGLYFVNGANLMASRRAKSWKSATPHQIATILGANYVEGKGPAPVKLPIQSTRLLKQALRIMLLLNGIPRATTLSCDSTELFDSCVRQAVLTRWLSKTHSVYREVASDLLESVLSFASHTFDEMASAGEVNLLVSDESVLRGLVGFLFSLYDVNGETAREGRLLGLCACLLESLLVFCSSAIRENENMLCVTTRHIVVCCNDDSAPLRSRQVLARSAIRRMALMNEDSDVLQNDASREAVVHLLSSLQGNFFKLCSPGSRWPDALLLLAGDMVHLSSKVDDGELLNSLSSMILQQATAIKRYDHSEALSYCLACMVASEWNLDTVASLVLEQCLVSRKQEDPLLEAAFCGVVPTLQTEVVQNFLNRLLVSLDDKDNTVSSHRLFELLITHIDGLEQSEQIASVSRHFFIASLDLLSPADEAEDKLHFRLTTGVAVITAMLHNRDILRVRERDIGLILSQTNALLGHGSVSEKVFTCSFEVLSLLLQRFPKQLYSCVALLVSVVHSLLRHTLSDAFSMDDQAQQFTRICELMVPHRDVYRKHVLGVLLQFVGKHDIHPACKKNILPGIYCLLDMLTHYETKQLNALMDTTGKATFRSVFQNYQRIHKYKGQY